MSNWPPADSEHIVSFEVGGYAVPQGSKEANSVTRKNKITGKREPVFNDAGYVKTFIRDSSGVKGAYWRADVRAACREALPYGFEPVNIPLAVQMVFIRTRPKYHFRTGKNAGLLKDSAPMSPVKRPDVLKQARGVEDALTGLLWTDDSLIVEEKLTKVFGKIETCHVSVWRLPEFVSLIAQLEAMEAAKVVAKPPVALEQQLALAA